MAADRSLFPHVRRYRKLPVEIEVMPLKCDDDLTLALDWIEDSGGQARIGYDDSTDTTVLLISTLEGEMMARWAYHDWVARGVQGEFYPIANPIFVQTYEGPVDV